MTGWLRRFANALCVAGCILRDEGFWVSNDEFEELTARSRALEVRERRQHTTWYCREGEGEDAYAAFVAYRDLLTNRSLRRVARETQRPLTLLSRWSEQWDWVARAAAWDRERQVRADFARGEVTTREHVALLVADWYYRRYGGAVSVCVSPCHYLEGMILSYEQDGLISTVTFPDTYLAVHLTTDRIAAIGERGPRGLS